MIDQIILSKKLYFKDNNRLLFHENNNSNLIIEEKCYFDVLNYYSQYEK